MAASREAQARMAKQFEQIYRLLCEKPHTSKELAGALGISIPTLHTKYLPKIKEWPGFITEQVSGDRGQTGPKAKAYAIVPPQTVAS